MKTAGAGNEVALKNLAAAVTLDATATRASLRRLWRV